MSDLTASVAIVALAIANFFLFVFMDKWIVGRSDAIATGTFGGAGAPFKHRRYRLQVNIIINTGSMSFMFGLLATGWLTIAQNANADIQLLAYLAAFGNGCGALGWLVTLPVDYRHLASVLRQAEAD
jgi:hypothetical protein